MRTAITQLLLPSLLILAACEGKKEPANMTEITIDDGVLLDQLRAASPQNRSLALRRVIQDSGQKCHRIENSAENGRYKNLSMWMAQCDDGRQWAIFIAPTGDAQVRDCADAATLGLPACNSLADAPKQNGQPGKN